MSQFGEPRARPPEGKGAPQSIMQRPPDACGRPRSAPSAHGTGRPWPRIASATSSTAATVVPASRKGCAEATTPGAEAAATVRRIGAPRPNRQVCKPSAGPYDGRRSWPGSEPRLPSPSTQGRQGRSCGLRTTAWHASWEGRTTTTSSSATSLSSSPTLPGHSWSICLLRRSPTGTTNKDQGNNKKGGDKEKEFPEVHDCFMIYGGQVVNASARHRKQEHREVCSVKVAAPVYLDWSDKPITFDQGDHPDCVPSPGRYPLVVDPVIGNARLTKVLMDGGISLNIIYAETLGLLGIDLSMIRAGAAPFHGIVPGKHVLPLGQLDLPVCFGTPSNFWKETLTFEVVGFRGTYHMVLGRPCYAKFMVVPNYTYLKLKMPGPKGIITVGSTYRHAYECDVECVEYAEALTESEALIADLGCLSKEAPDATRHAGNFEPAEAVKIVALDPSNDACKQIRIGSELDPK
jgi:hypothetical protein